MEVLFAKTHVGHKQEVGRLHLIKVEKENIAGKLLRGIPNQRILKDLGNSSDPDRRISYTTNHDLHNLKKVFNVQADVIFHSDDAKSFDILVQKYQDSTENPILAYKPYGAADKDIGGNNFFLVFMNAGQEDMLKMYGSNVIIRLHF